MINYKIKSISDLKDLVRIIGMANKVTTNATYFLYNKQTAVYIGYSSNIEYRLYSQVLFIEDLIESNNITRIKIKFFETTEEAHNNEKIEIYKRKPMYNIAYSNKTAKMGYFLPFETRSMIKTHFKANKGTFKTPSDVIIKAMDSYFGNARQLKLC